MKAALATLLFAMPALAADPAATAMNELGLDLQRRLAAGHEKANLCLSPYSIQSALAMTYAGAAGQTEAEMAEVLHYPEGDKIHDSLAALTKSLSEMTAESAKVAEESKKYGGPSEPIVFNLANRLYGQEGYQFKAPFLDFLKETYHAPLEKLDFSKAEAARKHINDWVEEQTKDRIKNLLPGGSVNGGTRLVLVNALYLKAPWAKEFSERATKPAPFHIAGGEAKDVPTMTRETKFGYAKRDGYTAVSLPYSSRDLHFLVLVPDEVNGLPALEKKLTAGALADCAKLEARDVLLHLPKFKLESDSIELGDELQALGMKTAFDVPKGSADFSRMAERTPSDYLYISAVIHKTFIAVDEKGTEAAAATAVMMRAGAAMQKIEPVEVKVDRPFLFAIQHGPTGACLFIGRVMDPR